MTGRRTDHPAKQAPDATADERRAGTRRTRQAAKAALRALTR